MSTPLFRKTLGNAAALTIGTGLEFVLQMVFVVLVGRALGVEDFGYFGYLAAIVSFAVVFANFGMNVVGVRELAALESVSNPREKATRETSIIAAMFRIRVFFSVLCVVAAVTVTLLSPMELTRRLAVWFIFLYVLFMPLDCMPILDAKKLSRWDVPGKLAGRFAMLAFVGGIFLWQKSISLPIVAASAGLQMFVNGSVGIFTLRRLGVPLKLFAATRDIGPMLRRAVPITWAGIMAAVFIFSQAVLVKWLSTPTETGWFALTVRYIAPLIMVKAVLYRLLLPLLSEVQNDRVRFARRLEKIFPAFALVFMPAAALAISLTDIFTVPLFGECFRGAILPTQIVISHFFFSGIGSIFGTALFALGYQKAYTWSLTIGCIAILVGGYILIPLYGAMGAAGASWMAELLSILIIIPLFWRETQPHIWMRLLRILICSLTAVVVFFVFCRILEWPSFVCFGMECAALVAGLWLICELTPASINTLVSTFKRPRTETA